jgi:steroid delta-isomerase-like uncharacterized protein
MQDNESIVRRFVDRFINGGDESVLSEIVHPDYIYRSPGEELRGREGLAALFRGYRGAFPDLKLVIDDLLATDEATVLSFTLTGTHRGELLGIPATGEPVKVHGMVRSRFREGMIAEEWEILDQLTLFEQLGVIGARQ